MSYRRPVDLHHPESGDFAGVTTAFQIGIGLSILSGHCPKQVFLPSGIGPLTAGPANFAPARKLAQDRLWSNESTGNLRLDLTLDRMSAIAVHLRQIPAAIFHGLFFLTALF